MFFYLFFFFQAEDGIRDHCVTGVQTCALPISVGCLLTGSPPECPQFIAGKTRDEPEKWGTPLTFAPLALPAECSLDPAPRSAENGPGPGGSRCARRVPARAAGRARRSSGRRA